MKSIEDLLDSSLDKVRSSALRLIEESDDRLVLEKLLREGGPLIAAYKVTGRIPPAPDKFMELGTCMIALGVAMRHAMERQYHQQFGDDYGQRT